MSLFLDFACIIAITVAGIIAIVVGIYNTIDLKNDISIAIAIKSFPSGIAIAYQHHQKCHGTDLLSAICALPLGCATFDPTLSSRIILGFFLRFSLSEAL